MILLLIVCTRCSGVGVHVSETGLFNSSLTLNIVTAAGLEEGWEIYSGSAVFASFNVCRGNLDECSVVLGCSSCRSPAREDVYGTANISKCAKNLTIKASTLANFASGEWNDIQLVCGQESIEGYTAYIPNIDNESWIIPVAGASFTPDTKYTVLNKVGWITGGGWFIDCAGWHSSEYAALNSSDSEHCTEVAVVAPGTADSSVLAEVFSVEIPKDSEAVSVLCSAPYTVLNVHFVGQHAVGEIRISTNASLLAVTDMLGGTLANISSEHTIKIASRLQFKVIIHGNSSVSFTVEPSKKDQKSKTARIFLVAGVAVVIVVIAAVAVGCMCKKERRRKDSSSEI